MSHWYKSLKPLALNEIRYVNSDHICQLVAQEDEAGRWDIWAVLKSEKPAICIVKDLPSQGNAERRLSRLIEVWNR